MACNYNRLNTARKHLHLNGIFSGGIVLARLTVRHLIAELILTYSQNICNNVACATVING